MTLTLPLPWTVQSVGQFFDAGLQLILLALLVVIPVTVVMLFLYLIFLYAPYHRRMIIERHKASVAKGEAEEKEWKWREEVLEAIRELHPRWRP